MPFVAVKLDGMGTSGPMKEDEYDLRNYDIASFVQSYA